MAPGTIYFYAGPNNTADNPFTWQGAFGAMLEGATGLYYMRVRWYDSAQARFLSRDPVRSTGPRQINPYQYALGNPQRYNDPVGLSPGLFGFSPFKGPGAVAPFNTAFETTVTAGSAAAVYEVVNSDPSAVEQANIPIGVAFISNTAQNIPAPGGTSFFAPSATGIVVTQVNVREGFVQSFKTY